MLNENSTGVNEVEILENEPTSKEIVVVSAQEVSILITKEEAAKLTQDIKSTSTALYVLLKKAHDTKAFIALGYNTWSEYIEKEFEFSRTRSYQLINQANVIDEINDASGEVLYITERDARSIKSRLPEITKKLKDMKESGSLSKDDAKEIIDEEVDNAGNKGKKGGGSGGDYDEDSGNMTEDDNGAMEEWKPEGIDMDKMKRMLSDEDKFYFDNLIVTLKIFESMPNAMTFGQTIKKSSEDKKELLKLSESAFAWIAQLIDEVE